MSSHVRHRGLSLVAAAVPAGGIWWFVRDPLLAGSVGLTVLAAALLWVRVSRRYGERFEGETWQDRTWVSLTTGVVSLAAFNGTLLLPLSLSYRVGIQALVVAGALVGYAVGTLTEIERSHSDGRPGGQREDATTTGD